MNKFRVPSIVLLCLLLFASPCIAKGAVRTIEGTVTKVSNGDTIHVTATNGTKLNVRLYGIDAPETSHVSGKTGGVSKKGQPFGDNAQQALEQMVVKKPVRLEVMAIDRQKRTVAIVWVVDIIVNKEMVRYGWAWAFKPHLNSPHTSEYIQAEEQARREHRGLWQQSNPQPPWEFRKM